ATSSTGFYHFLNPLTSLKPLPRLALPLPRAPVSGARKSEILASRPSPCKRYFDTHELRRNWRNKEE
ncbi:hypothetical protein, partial [Paraburkholderia fungorum]|uniref:hypothetical protein n=1 Tax=Paraburkholderia fungorum TaxID=134537 RepID=UPI001C859243